MSSPFPRPVVAFPALLYGMFMLMILLGFSAYFIGVLLGFFRIFADTSGFLKPVIQQILWYSGIPVILGLGLVLFDLFVLLPKKRTRVDVMWEPPVSSEITVALTAYNDESSIGLAVKDFLAHPKVKRVIVVDNNSRDRTSQVVHEAGGIVIPSPNKATVTVPGGLYGKALVIPTLNLRSCAKGT